MPIDWKSIEEKWRKAWEDGKIFEANADPSREKFFLTVAYPYPNSPQHVGHGRTFTLTDVYARYKRMRGFNVLFPMAFHYTGTPILAMSKRLATGDKDLEDTFTTIYKVPKEDLKEFVEPIKIAQYFHREIKQGMKDIGYSIDWRREFTTIDPQYSKFIEWQFRQLRAKNLITQGSHPVGWCPNCGNPVGQHDTKGDVEPEIDEFTLIKFIFNEHILPAATLRPETVFGVTNMWLRPDIEYVKARVDGESWIISPECVEKLRFLNRKVAVEGTVHGKDLMGKYVINPMTNEKIPIFPAAFVDPNNGTGVVMSVPGHAPYDYVALEDLKKAPAELLKYGVDPKIIQDVYPISLITVEGYSEFPAVDVVKRMGIESQADPKTEEATKEIYSREFHAGRMKDNLGKYSGMPVSKAKEEVKADMLREGKADVMYEIINKPVICRCGAECVVKIFENQWFIDYGNPEWKALARECLHQMRIVPEELRPEYEYVIGWLKRKACARKAGLGTKLPWDPEWIIESLSDSVIYMCYYTISNFIRQYQIDANQLNDKVFNYIFLGQGKPDEIANEVNLDAELLKKMRAEFLYFYPLDCRHSGRDLVPNHLTFFIFNHAAIFPRELWPRQIVVNGSVLMEGKKMSKSLGNIIPLRDAVKMFGADNIRLAVLSTAELLADADFSTSLAKAINSRLERFYAFSHDIIGMQKNIAEETLRTIDRWMLSRLQTHIKTVTEAMEMLRTREAIQDVLYKLDQDVQWYLRRTSTKHEPSRKGAVAKVLYEVLDVWVRLLAPFAPFICEEIWHDMGHKDFVATAPWPTYNAAKIDLAAEEAEKLIEATIEDTTNILRATGMTPKKIYYYTPAKWKWKAYITALKSAEKAPLTISTVMKTLMTDPEMKKYAKQLAPYIQKTVEEINRMPEDQRARRLNLGVINEKEILSESREFFQHEFSAEIQVFEEEDINKYDPQKKAQQAIPYRPAIYIE
jgi:leucyl-tRNA synthetase